MANTDRLEGSRYKDESTDRFSVYFHPPANNSEYTGPVLYLTFGVTESSRSVVEIHRLNHPECPIIRSGIDDISQIWNSHRNGVVHAVLLSPREMTTGVVTRR